MAFSHAQNSVLVDCSFTEQRWNIVQNPSSALQVLLNATAPGAAYNSEERYPHPRCLPRTRTNTIQNIKEWAENGTSKIVWLHGPAGAGKSAVAQTMCETWAEMNQLLASFFFSRTSSLRNTMERFIPSIASQASLTLTGQLELILSVIEKNPQILWLDASIQLEKLLVDPLKTILQTHPETFGHAHYFFIVIDAVDECIGNENQLRLLSLILSLVTSESFLPIRFLIVSRPEAHIRHAFNNLLKPVSSVESMYGALEDVYKYLEFKFAEMHDSEKHWDTMQYVPRPWPGPDVLRELTTRSGGYFIYAATIVRYVDEEGYLCTDRLEEVLNRNVRGAGVYPYRELDKVYSQILSTTRNLHCLTRILGCIIVGRRALVSFDSLAPNVPTSAIISALFSFRPGELKMTLRGLHSLLSLSECDTDDIRFYHASFSDYLLDKERSECYYISYDATIQDIYHSSLGLIRLSALANPINPSNDWAVAMLCWARVGRPSKQLLDYLQGNGGSALTLMKAVVTQSRQWSDDLHFRMLCVLCGMIRLLKDQPSSQEMIELHTLIELCQMAIGSYLSPSNEMVGLQCIQDVRTLLETDPLKSRSWEFQRATIKGVLNLSSNEQVYVNRFVSYLSQIRDRLFHWSQFSIATDLETGTWLDSRDVFKDMIDKLLDNKSIWGDSCNIKIREAHLQMHLKNSTRWAELLRPKPTPVKPKPVLLDVGAYYDTYASPPTSPTSPYDRIHRTSPDRNWETDSDSSEDTAEIQVENLTDKRSTEFVYWDDHNLSQFMQSLGKVPLFIFLTRRDAKTTLRGMSDTELEGHLKDISAARKCLQELRMSASNDGEEVSCRNRTEWDPRPNSRGSGSDVEEEMSKAGGDVSCAAQIQ